MTSFTAMSREEVEHAARNYEQQYLLLKASRDKESGPFSGMPWYVRATAWFGLPVALLSFTMAQDAGVIPSLSRATHANVAVVSAAFAAHITKTDELLVRLTTGLRIMCENSSRDVGERNNCGNIR